MRKIIQYRWILLAAWITATILFTLNQPNLKHILSEKGEATISEDAPSKKASAMLEKMKTAKGGSLILVFYNKNKLSYQSMKEIQEGINDLNTNHKELEITDILDPFGTPESTDQLISKDKTTLLVQVSYNQGKRDKKEVIEDFNHATKDISVKHYITGETAISSDYTNAVSTGIDKSAIITLIFILLVLILMFRSVITPLVSLFVVAISYLCTMGVLGIFIDLFDFPITNFTKMFIILVLFGIGTDYHILLLNRFKEELSNGLSVDDAIVTSLKTAGKTIIYSGLTVFIGFLSLSFVQFPIYRSANAVAIGIAILLLEILTLTPILMKLLAGKLFWPSKSTAGHKESKFWTKMTSNSVKHPVVSLIVVAIIIAPVILFNTSRLSFDSMADMDSNLPSIKGFNIIADKFGDGKAMPITLVIKSKKSMANNEALATIDKLTETLDSIDGIHVVSGPTRPKGDAIKLLYTNHQINTVADGLSDANEGISKVSDGLETIDSYLTIPDFSKVKDLSNGTNKLANGMNAITAGLIKIDDGISKGSTGSNTLATGTKQLKTGITTINTALISISDNLTKIKSGYDTLGVGYKTISTSFDSLNQLELAMESNIARIDKKLPGDPDVAMMKVMLYKLSSSIKALSLSMNTANTNYEGLTSKITLINKAMATLIKSTGPNSKLILGIDKLETGAKSLSTGLKTGSKGQQQIIDNMVQLKTGADTIRTGVDTLYQKLDTLGNGIGDLKKGVNSSKDGLDKIGNGIIKANGFLIQLTKTKTFYIPKEQFDNKDIVKMLDNYMSKDRTYAKLSITLDTEPYADSSIKLIDKLNVVVKNQLEGTTLSKSDFGFSGATAASKDMSDMATHDITFTQCIVLLSIFILLIFITRSFWIPVYIVASLIISYYTALSATTFISGRIFNNPNGLAWNVPFFSFVMIAALGVDYSIFLMERFKEHSDLSAKEAIVIAAKNIGGVVMSAAIILSGTFATLYPSDLVVLQELAICVIIGLLLLSMVLLPVIIPALITLQEKMVEKNAR